MPAVLWPWTRTLTSFPKSETGSAGLPDSGDSLDLSTFEQILEMDDDEDEREFSRSIVYGFFEQAEATFGKMDKSLYVDTSFISPAFSRSFSFTSLYVSEHLPNMALARLPKAKNISKSHLPPPRSTRLPWQLHSPVKIIIIAVADPH